MVVINHLLTGMILQVGGTFPQVLLREEDLQQVFQAGDPIWEFYP